jgi:hypothetical protein
MGELIAHEVVRLTRLRIAEAKDAGRSSIPMPVDYAEALCDRWFKLECAVAQANALERRAAAGHVIRARALDEAAGCMEAMLAALSTCEAVTFLLNEIRSQASGLWTHPTTAHLYTKESIAESLVSCIDATLGPAK